MKPFRPKSSSDQLASHLKEEILSGRITGEMPGITRMVQILGVNSVTTSKAVQQLEREGLVIAQGERRPRLISESARTQASSIKIGILCYDQQLALRSDTLQLRQTIIDSGHTPVIASKSMQDLGMKLNRIIKHINSHDVDAWMIYGGTSELLQWFSNHELPAFAIYGRLNSANIAGIGIKKSKVTHQLVEQLVALNHKRIVLLVREERRKPTLGLPEREFLNSLESHGIQTGPYNIPDWTDTPEGLEQCLDKLFKHTPPTALIICDSASFHAVQVYLAGRGIKAPHDISLFCNDYCESFDWCRPPISHIDWDHRPTIRRAVQWIDNISKGIEDKKLSYIMAKHVEGGTIGKANS